MPRTKAASPRESCDPMKQEFHLGHDSLTTGPAFQSKALAPMFVTDWLSRLHHRLGFRNRARPRRRNPLSHFAAQVSLTQLEDRCLPAVNVLGPQALVNSRVAGTQEFSVNSDRSIAVTDAGTT